MLKRLFPEEKATIVLFIAAIAMNVHFGVPLIGNSREYVTFLFGLVLPAFAIMILVGYLVYRYVSGQNSHGIDLTLLLRVIATVFVGFIAFSRMKSLIPLVNGHLYDDIFSKIDIWLFLGHSPTLALLNIKATWFIKATYFAYTGFYALFPLVFMFAFVVRDTVLVRRLVAGMLAVNVIGLLLYYLLPSMGPLFTSPELFAHIPNKWAKVLMDGFIAVKADPSTFLASPHMGIAAFPSLHAAQFTFFGWMSARRFKWTAYFIIPWGVLLYIATVYMGWHYVIDLVAGAGIAMVAVGIVKRIRG